MDGLRPEVDELDRFNKRASSNATANVSAGKASSKASPKTTPAKKTRSLGGVVVLCMICLSAGFAWFSWQQQVEISALTERLSDASGFMDRSKLLIARLEGKLSETGVELAETGTAAEKKLAFLDSEMRKLWGVAYDKNRKTIDDNQKEVKRLSVQLSALEKSSSATAKKSTKVLADQAKKITSLTNINASLESRLGQAANEISILRAEQDASNKALIKRLDAQKNALDSAAKESGAYLAKAAKLDLSIESINASRRQLNERVVALDQKLNALQLKK